MLPHIPPQAHRTILFALLVLSPIIAGQPDTPQALTHAIATQYLPLFDIKQNKNKTKETQAIIDGNTKKPHLDHSTQVELLLNKVYANSQALNDLLQAKKSTRVDFPEPIWQSINLFQHTQNLTPLHQVALAIRLTTPTTNPAYIAEDQHITNTFLNNTKLTETLSTCYDELTTILPSLLALYDNQDNPFWDKRTEKFCNNMYGGINGKFRDPSYIQWQKRLRCDLPIVFFGTMSTILLLAGTFCCLLELFKEQKLSYLYLTFIILGATILKGVHSLYTKHKTIATYIVSRLLDVQNLLHIAQHINTIIQDNPMLKPLCSPKLVHTNKLLTRTHQNTTYNQLIDILLTHDLKHWSLWSDSIGILLTTLTQLQENMNILGEFLYESGQISTYVYAAQLLQNNYKKDKPFIQPKILTQNTPYIHLQGIWAPHTPTHTIAPWHIHINVQPHNTLAIVGTHIPKQQIIQTTIQTIIRAMAGLPVPARQATITPFHAIYHLQAPPEDPTHQDYPFTKGLKLIQNYQHTIQASNQANKKTITLYQNFIRTIHRTHHDALTIALTTHNINNYPNNINIISTDNPTLIQVLNSHTKSHLQHILTHYISGIRHFELTPNRTYHKLDIDFFDKETGQKQIAAQARLLAKQIEKSQKQVKEIALN